MASCTARGADDVGTVFVKVFGENWKSKAASTKWTQLKGDFRGKAYKLLIMRSLEDRCQAPRSSQPDAVESAKKRPRVVFREPVQWAAESRHPRLEILCDSTLIVSWLNGRWKCRNRTYNDRVRLMRRIVQGMAEADEFRPRLDSAD